MSPEQAKAFGIIDHVVDSRPDNGEAEAAEKSTD
jgi:ATP-dependent protease ClpP protease subunit